MAKVEVRSLQKLDQKNIFTDVLHVTTWAFLTDLAKVLEGRGYRALVGFSSSSNTGFFFPLVVPAGNNEDKWYIVITTEKSCYDPDIRLRLHIDELFTVLPPRSRMSVKCVKSQLIINNSDLKIAVYRTLSVPVDGRVDMLPASPDRLPIQTLAAYYRELRASGNASLIDIANKSGVFLPIHQCEAIGISTPTVIERKVRIFEGGIDIITGEKLDKRNSKHGSAQYYILVLSQEQLDGIPLDDKIGRKFVLMPIGSRYPMVKQSTRREDIGGLLIEVTPMTAEMDLINGEVVVLYHVKMQFELPETLRTQDIEIPKFSPFITISDAILNTTYSDAALKDYPFWYEDRLTASNNTRAQAGLTSSSLPVAKPKCAPATAVHGARPIIHAATPEDASSISFNSHGRGGYGRGDHSNCRMPKLGPVVQPPLDPNKKNPRPLVSPLAPSNNKSSSTQIFAVPFPPTTHLSRSNFSNWSSPKRSPGWCICGHPSRRRRLLRKGCRALIRTKAPHLRLPAVTNSVESRV